jgi:hypothetical protein
MSRRLQPGYSPARRTGYHSLTGNMKSKMSLLCLLMLLCGTIAQGQEWNRYVESKDRKDILKKASRKSGIGAMMAANATARVIWVTDPVARALVSQMIDAGLSKSAANGEYLDLREQRYHLFILVIQRADRGASQKPWSEQLEPLDRKAFYLQRSNDPYAKSSEGEVTGARLYRRLADGLSVDPDLSDGHLYVVLVPRKTEVNDPVVKDLNDEVTPQFAMSGKSVVLKFKIKDLVARVEDL